MGKLVRQIKKFWPIILLLILSFLLRIYKLEELFYFSYDEAIPAFVSRKLIEFGDISLLGGVTPFGYHLAPYFYWFLAGLLFLGNLSPIIWGWAGAIIAVLTTTMMFLVGKEFFNRKVGYLAATFWVFSYLANLNDRHMWALYWGPFVSLLVIYSLYKMIKGNDKFSYLLGITLALAIHADPSNLIFVALAVIAWVIYKISIKKSTIISSLLIIFSFTPLAVFDLTHNFANTKPFVKYLSQGRTPPGSNPQGFIDNSLYFPRVFARLIYPSGDHQIAKSYSYCPDYVSGKLENVPVVFVLAASLILLVFIVTSLKLPFQFKILSLLIVLYFLGIQLFGTFFRSDIFEHYITGLFTVFLLILAYFVAKLPKKIWLIVLAGFIFFNLQKLFLAKNSMGLTYKRQAIEYSMQAVGDRDFSLDSISTCWKYGGYRYLFAVFGREPVKSYVDPNLAHLYGSTKVASEHPETVVAFVAYDFVPETDPFYKQYAGLKTHEVE